MIAPLSLALDGQAVVELGIQGFVLGLLLGLVVVLFISIVFRG